MFNAAKRASKKRALDDATSHQSQTKRRPQAAEKPGESVEPSSYERSLALPECDISEDEISSCVLHTNRAPLLMAFAVTLLKYTMPEQPISSRLSLAQAVVSIISRSRAVSLGLDTGKSAEEEGWGQGQPMLRIMGRDIRVMKRWGYEYCEQKSDPDSQTFDDSGDKEYSKQNQQPPLWGLDLEAMKKSDGPSTLHSKAGELPIYTPRSARGYLCKSFVPTNGSLPGGPSSNKLSTTQLTAVREHNLGFLLRALELLFESWASVLDRSELDRRAWNWYIRVRPAVETGPAGWGGKGDVKLADILDLRRKG